MLPSADDEDPVLTRWTRDFYQQLLALSDQDEMGPLLQRALSLIVRVTRAEQAYIEARLSSDQDDPPWWLAHGLDTDDLEQIRARCSRGIIAEALATGTTIRTASALLDPRFCSLSSVKRHEIQAVLCAPVGAPPAGVVYLQGRAKAGPFTEQDVRHVEWFARQLSTLVERIAHRQLAARLVDRTRELRAHFCCAEIVGRSTALADVLRQAALVAPLDVHVLLTGPSGTGKSLLARAIAANSPRRGAPLIELNCAALPESLLESELFGAQRGAHSTAHRALPGKLSAAQGGTLFLDEVAELSMGSQAKLLQLLQSGLYYPLGATTPVRADVRLIAASNVDLREAVAEKRFREDLFYRLHIMPLRLPPLSARREDIDLLLLHCVREAAARHRFPVPSVSGAALLACREASWSGNIRELAHAAEAAVIRAHGEGSPEIELHHIFSHDGNGEEPRAFSFQLATRSYQRKLLSEALEIHDWNISAAARALELTRSHMYNLIHAHGLRRAPTMQSTRAAGAEQLPRGTCADAAL